MRPVKKEADARTMQRMRIVLQETGTGRYLRDLDSWSEDSSEAKDFVSSTTAFDFCLAHHITAVQVVLKFDEEKYDIVLPMLPPRGFRHERPSQSA